MIVKIAVFVVFGALLYAAANSWFHKLKDDKKTFKDAARESLYALITYGGAIYIFFSFHEYLAIAAQNLAYEIIKYTESNITALVIVSICIFAIFIAVWRFVITKLAGGYGGTKLKILSLFVGSIGALAATIVFTQSSAALLEYGHIFVIAGAIFVILAVCLYWCSDLREPFGVIVGYLVLNALAVYTYYIHTGINLVGHIVESSHETYGPLIVINVILFMMSVAYATTKTWNKRLSYKIICTLFLALLAYNGALAIFCFFGAANKHEWQVTQMKNLLQIKKTDLELKAKKATVYDGLSYDEMKNVLTSKKSDLPSVNKALAATKKLEKDIEDIVAKAERPDSTYNDPRVNEIVGKTKDFLTSWKGLGEEAQAAQKIEPCKTYGPGDVYYFKGKKGEMSNRWIRVDNCDMSLQYKYGEYAIVTRSGKRYKKGQVPKKFFEDFKIYAATDVDMRIVFKQ
jgi:hypothetical protein